MFRNISAKRQALPAMASARRQFYEGVIYRFKFLMLATLLCAAMTVIGFILGQVSCATRVFPAIQAHSFYYRRFPKESGNGTKILTSNIRPPFSREFMECGMFTSWHFCVYIPHLTNAGLAKMVSQ